MRIAVVGGGINGVMAAWALSELGCDVVVYERSTVMGETSSHSTKLLHGGLRYLEHGAFGLVREALREREWWMRQAPHLAAPLQFVIPVNRNLSRPRMLLRLGLWLYDVLAGSSVLPRSERLDADEVAKAVPELRRDGLRGGFAYTDVQMDDAALGAWAADKVRAAGVEIREHTEVERVSPQGEVHAESGMEFYDAVINATGPWSGELLDRSAVKSAYRLRLVRGSHLVVNRRLRCAVLMQVPEDRRVVFAIPWKGRVLLGTTEVEQDSPEPTECSNAEAEYLVAVWARYFNDPLRTDEISAQFAGVRPLLMETGRATRNTREFALEKNGKLVTVHGGKWTTARVLGQRAASLAISDLTTGD